MSVRGKSYMGRRRDAKERAGPENGTSAMLKAGQSLLGKVNSRSDIGKQLLGIYSTRQSPPRPDVEPLLRHVAGARGKKI